MEKNMETTMMGHIGTTLRIHSFIASEPKVRFVMDGCGLFPAGFC